MKKIIIAILAFGIIVSCEKQEDEIRLDDLSIQKSNLQSNSSVDPKTDGVTVPFKSDFFTEQEGELNFDACDGDLIALNTQVGGGNATHIGIFTTRMEFCMNFAEGPDFATYWAVDGVFIAANGDELYFTVSGQVIMLDEPHPFYLASFDDPFTFTGGTGRFEGASGGGTTNSLTNFEHTDHKWTGTITLLKSS